MPLLRRELFLSAATALLVGASCAAAQDAPAAAEGAAPDAAPATDAAARYGQQKVVYHVNNSAGEDGKGYNGVLGNLRNHLNAVGPENLDARVVINGNGIGLLQLAATDQALQAKIADLKADGVRFLVCENTLTGRDIDPATLFDVFDDDIVPAGVAEIALLEQQGFAYIKP